MIRDELFYSIPYNKIPKLLIQDAGLTQIEAGSKTVLGIGPGKYSQLKFSSIKSNRQIFTSSTIT